MAPSLHAAIASDQMDTTTRKSEIRTGWLIADGPGRKWVAWALGRYLAPQMDGMAMALIPFAGTIEKGTGVAHMMSRAATLRQSCSLALGWLGNQNKCMST
jgi:hypothetical protein